MPSGRLRVFKVSFILGNVEQLQNEGVSKMLP